MFGLRNSCFRSQTRSRKKRKKEGNFEFHFDARVTNRSNISTSKRRERVVVSQKKRVSIDSIYYFHENYRDDRANIDREEDLVLRDANIASVFFPLAARKKGESVGKLGGIG